MPRSRFREHVRRALMMIVNENIDRITDVDLAIRLEVSPTYARKILEFLRLHGAADPDGKTDRTAAKKILEQLQSQTTKTKTEQE